MKINFVTFSCNLTGGNRVVMELINDLSARGHDITLVTFGKESDLHWISLQGKVVHIHKTFIQRVISFLSQRTFGYQLFPEMETRQILEVLPPADINVATLSYTGFAVHRSEAGIPFQYHMHYEPFVREPGYKNKVITESYYLPVHKIGNSTWVKDIIKKETGGALDGLVFPAIDHAIFNTKKVRSGIDTSKKITIVSLAKYKWWKGFPDALKAIEIVRKAGYDIDFQAFGGAFDTQTLPDDVKDIPFTFVGSKANEELAEFYSNADILISASYFESFPLPPLEAMACGTPVVTTRYGTEDYAFDGKNAYVVEPKNPELMAGKIIELIENQDTYTRFSKEGAQTAKQFTWQTAGEEMERLFKKALAE